MADFCYYVLSILKHLPTMFNVKTADISDSMDMTHISLSENVDVLRGQNSELSIHFFTSKDDFFFHFHSNNLNFILILYRFKIAIYLCTSYMTS